jgi:hypothetical protein
VLEQHIESKLLSNKKISWLTGDWDWSFQIFVELPIVLFSLERFGNLVFLSILLGCLDKKVIKKIDTFIRFYHPLPLSIVKMRQKSFSLLSPFLVHKA